jgi:membrane protein
VLVLRDADVDALPWWQRAPLRLVRVVAAVAADLAEGQLSLRAMSLVYTTLLSLVPVLAISFSILKGFGVHNQIEPVLLNLLGPLGEKGAEITGRVIAFVENVNVGVLGSVGLGLLVLTVVSLLQKIERAFNFAWRITRHRRFAQRFSSYLTVVVIGPVLVFSALGITASLVSAPVVGGLVAIEPVGKLFELLSRLVPFALIVAAFTFLYAFLPNTRVRLSAALAGGVLAGILWEAAGWAFASFVVTSLRYTAIYSAFATLILFLVWLYVGWLILLVGASIAFYVQNPHRIGGRQGPPVLSNRVKERLALAFARTIARAFYQVGTAATSEALAARHKVPTDVVETVVAALERAGLVVRSGDATPVFLPARPPEAMPIKEVLDAVREAEEATYGVRDAAEDAAAGAVMARFDEAAEAALADITLKDLALDEQGPAASRAAPAPLRARGQG